MAGTGELAASTTQRQTRVQVQRERAEVRLLIRDVCEVDTLDIMPLLRSLCRFGTNLTV